MIKLNPDRSFLLFLQESLSTGTRGFGSAAARARGHRWHAARAARSGAEQGCGGPGAPRVRGAGRVGVRAARGDPRVATGEAKGDGDQPADGKDRTADGVADQATAT